MKAASKARSRTRSRPRELDARTGLLVGLIVAGVVVAVGIVASAATEVIEAVVRRLSFPFLDPASSVLEPVFTAVLVLLLVVVVARRGRAPLHGRLLDACLAILPLTFLGEWGVHVVNGAFDPGQPSRLPFRLTEYRHGRSGTWAELAPPASTTEARRLLVDAAVVGEDLPVGSTVLVEVRPGRLGRRWIAGYIVAPR